MAAEEPISVIMTAHYAVAEKKRVYYVTHAEERRAYATAYKVTHPEKVRAYRATYNAAHAEERHAYNAAYDAAHREERRAASAACRTAHPEKNREHQHRRRARVRSQFAAPVDAQAIYRRDRGRCHLCGKRVKRTEASMDHLIPISLGGIHAPWNVSLAHLKCNLRRGVRGSAQTMLALC